ncbi:hypothetical protein Trydic_g15169 [Trypoxylus dichotomus]
MMAIELKIYLQNLMLVLAPCCKVQDRKGFLWRSKNSITAKEQKDFPASAVTARQRIAESELRNGSAANKVFLTEESKQEMHSPANISAAQKVFGTSWSFRTKRDFNRATMLTCELIILKECAVTHSLQERLKILVEFL